LLLRDTAVRMTSGDRRNATHESGDRCQEREDMGDDDAAGDRYRES
jgi:hypothetical protein